MKHDGIIAGRLSFAELSTVFLRSYFLNLMDQETCGLEFRAFRKLKGNSQARKPFSDRPSLTIAVVCAIVFVDFTYF